MEIENASAELKDDSSFEILPSSEEEEYSASTPIWTGNLNGSFSESMRSPCSETMINESDDEKCIVFINNSTPGPALQKKFIQNPDSNIHQSHENIQNFLQQHAGNIRNSFDAKSENYSNSTDKNVVIEIPEMDSPVFVMIEEMGHQNQPNEEVENNFKTSDDDDDDPLLFPEKKPLIANLVKDSENQRTASKLNFIHVEKYFETLDEDRLPSDERLLVASLVEDTESQRTVGTLNVYQSENNVVTPPLDKKPENAVVQMHPDRHSRKFCSVMKHSFKICGWLRNNKCLQNFVDGAKSSFHIFFNMFELEMNTMFGMEEPLKILIIADTVDSLAIEDAFCQTLCGQIVISRCQIEEDHTTMPVLPVGYKCALQVVQSKINIARQVIRNCEKVIFISTANFIAEIVPQRWQKSTVLCLEDPNLQLNLHNFSATVPVPNEYIYQAQRYTPDEYPLKDRGFAVTLEDAIGYTVKTQLEDAQEFLSNINHSTSLKSAADILAGLYKKYINRFARVL